VSDIPYPLPAHVADAIAEKALAEAEQARAEAKKARYEAQGAERALREFEIKLEREEHKRWALAEPLRDFLAVMDNLELALASPAAGEGLRHGVELILRQVQEILRRHGVREIQAAGKRFDPALHEAVSREEHAGVAVPTVSEELRRGFVLHDRLLRPAMVKVAVPPEAAADEDSGPTN